MGRFRLFDRDGLGGKRPGELKTKKHPASIIIKSYKGGKCSMCKCSVFPVVDLPVTGRNTHRLRENAGMTVWKLQAYIGFEYPQAIYK